MTPVSGRERLDVGENTHAARALARQRIMAALRDAPLTLRQLQHLAEEALREKSVVQLGLAKSLVFQLAACGAIERDDKDARLIRNSGGAA